MNLVFFIKSTTILLDNYTIKDVPGSSGRLDVISRCILATLLNKDGFERNIQIWVFLDQFGTFIFNPEFFNYKIFPKNELSFTDYFVSFLKRYLTNGDQSHNPLSSIKDSKLNLIEAISHFQKLNYDLYILHENGQDFSKLLNGIKKKESVLFILGSQVDEYIYSKELSALKIPIISIGNKSYLASSVIRLLKLYLIAL
ncbi:MAG: hypothetical protein ACFFG0_19310 [Candidatus Thorarchaeota archaeon]